MRRRATWLTPCAGAADGLESTAATIAQTMGTGAADASRRLVEATEAMGRDLREVLLGFGATLDATGAALTQGAAAGGETLRGAAAGMSGDLAAAALGLRDAGEAAGAALRRGGSDASAGMTEAAGTLVQGASGLSDRLSALGSSATSLADGARALSQSARDAAAPWYQARRAWLRRERPRAMLRGHWWRWRRQWVRPWLVLAPLLQPCRQRTGKPTRWRCASGPLRNALIGWMELLPPRCGRSHRDWTATRNRSQDLSARWMVGLHGA